jgi:hypothetical protein
MKSIYKLIDHLGEDYQIKEVTFHFKNFKKKGFDISLKIYYQFSVVYTIEPTYRDKDKYMVYGSLVRKYGSTVLYFRNIHQVIKFIKNNR